MFGRVPKNAAAHLGTRPNSSESHSEISTRVPFCIASRRPQFGSSPRYNRFLCGKKTFKPFFAAGYDMVVMKVPADSMLGKYSELMPYLCAKEGMKPVCNDPAACKSDPASLYIGQTGKLTSAAGRSAKGGAPKGLANASKHFAATCGYSGKGKPVVCEGIKGGVSTPPASNPGFVCGRKGPSRLAPF